MNSDKSIEGKIDEKLEKNSKLVIENLYKAGLVPLAAATIRYPSPENILLLTETLKLAWKIMENDFNKTNKPNSLTSIPPPPVNDEKITGTMSTNF